MLLDISISNDCTVLMMEAQMLYKDKVKSKTSDLYLLKITKDLLKNKKK